MKLNNKQILALASGLALLGTGIYLLVKSGKPKNGNTPVIDPSKLLSADMDLTPYRSQINFVSTCSVANQTKKVMVIIICGKGEQQVT
jgi:hypothetical protein